MFVATEQGGAMLARAIDVKTQGEGDESAERTCKRAPNAPAGRPPAALQEPHPRPDVADHVAAGCSTLGTQQSA